ncbi:MerR family transcriptional regulator [Arthrobacter sp. SAFR-044]|uniref:MerR family transcriptional regulator n=1 Tax=Arthrobacter sp. SAFR-044 TaxID=3387278 RepID=UPI003F7C1F74
MEQPEKPRWSVGELAAATGVTVRALHHYDNIGLLHASDRTAAGHRRYTEPDLRRLYSIRTLRSLGVPLGEIAPVLDESGGNPESLQKLLLRQLDALGEQALQLEQLQRTIRELLARLSGQGHAEPAYFTTVLERMTMFENYFTEDQRRELDEQRARLGREAADESRTEWVGLVEEGLRQVDGGVPATSPEARELVHRWDELGSRFHSSEGTKAAARSMWAENSAELSQALPWTAQQMQALVAHLEAARGTGQDTAADGGLS